MINKGLLTEEQKRDLVIKALQKHTNYDYAYMSALMFPEDSESARIPSKFGNPSSTFT